MFEGRVIRQFWCTLFVFLVCAACGAEPGGRGPSEGSDFNNISGADRILRFGVQGSWGEETDLGIGARLIVSVPLFITGFDIVGSFDWFFANEANSFGDNFDFDYYEININGVKPLLDVGVARPYFGAGLNMAHAEGGDTKNGLNLVAGLELDLGANPFIELRYELGGGKQTVITGGLIPTHLPVPIPSRR